MPITGTWPCIGIDCAAPLPVWHFVEVVHVALPVAVDQGVETLEVVSRLYGRAVNPFSM